MENKKGKYKFHVEPFTEDFSGLLTWGVLGNEILRCASLHAGTHGFGYADLISKNWVWVLSRLVIEMDEMPRSGEKYEIHTWVSRVYRQFTDRNFAIVGEDGKVFGYATSVWSLIDFGTRQSVDLQMVEDGRINDFVIDEVAPIAAPERVRVKDATPVSIHKAAYSDLDINGHVNSIRYIQLALDEFSSYIYGEGKRPCRVEVGYAAEGMCGDQLGFYSDGITEQGGQIEVRNDSGVVLAKLSVKLK